MGMLDEVTRQAGKGLDAILNGIIHSVDGAINAGIGKLGGMLGSEAPEASKSVSNEGFMSRMVSAMGLGGEAERGEPVRELKLGRSADIHNAERVQTASMNTGNPLVLDCGHEVLGTLAAQFSGSARKLDGVGISNFV